MVHTAKLYLILTDEDIYRLERKYKENITLIGGKLDEKYEGIINTFTKRYKQWFMFLTIDFIKLLGKPDITEEDYREVEDKINIFLYDVFGAVDKEFVLIRLDYRLDVRIQSKEERELLMHLYKKTTEKHRFKKKYDQYESTIYFNSKSIQATAYDKEKERNSKGKDIEEYEEDILRFEVRLQNRHLNYIKHAHKIEKKLENYFKKELYTKYMQENMGCLLYKGNYHKMYRCEKIIEHSQLSVKDKKELREFLIFVSKSGIEKAKNKYSKYRFNKILKQLEELEINPIIIPKNYKIRLTEGYILNPFYNSN